MLLKLTLASIAFAAVAAQSNSAITAEIERLQLLMASREARDANLNPSMVTEGGDLNIRLPRQNSAFRLTRQTEVDVGALADRVNLLETSTVPGVAANARTVAYQAAFNASLTSMDRLNARMDTMISRMASISAEVSTQMSSMESTLASRVDTGLESVTVQGAAQQAAIAAQGTAMAALNVSMQARLDAAIVATRALGSDTIYTQWGSKMCTATGGLTVTKHFDGWTFGSIHDRNGGGGVMQCLKNAGGSQGGRPTGGDSADIIVPIILDHVSYTNNAVPQRPIPCAKCLYTKTCYLETGVATCQASGYRSMYFGMLFGSHEGHGGNNNRVCVDTERDSDWNQGGSWGGYIYPTIERGNIASRSGQKVVKCLWCCKA
jgi:hypothetical protein